MCPSTVPASIVVAGILGIAGMFAILATLFLTSRVCDFKEAWIKVFHIVGWPVVAAIFLMALSLSVGEEWPSGPLSSLLVNENSAIIDESGESDQVLSSYFVLPWQKPREFTIVNFHRRELTVEDSDSRVEVLIGGDLENELEYQSFILDRSPDVANIDEATRVYLQEQLSDYPDWPEVKANLHAKQLNVIEIY